MDRKDDKRIAQKKQKKKRNKKAEKLPNSKVPVSEAASLRDMTQSDNIEDEESEDLGFVDEYVGSLGSVAANGTMLHHRSVADAGKADANHQQFSLHHAAE